MAGAAGHDVRVAWLEKNELSFDVELGATLAYVADNLVTTRRPIQTSADCSAKLP